MISFGVDMLDGYISRKQKTSSKFGLQLDTIIDTLNYPIFCALFSYVFFFNQSWLGSGVAIVILIFCSLRLTRMAIDGIRIDENKKKYYDGVTTPHLLLAVILIYFVSYFLKQLPAILTAIVMISLSGLMITKVKTYKPKSLRNVVIIVIAIVVVSFYGLMQSI